MVKKPKHFSMKLLATTEGLLIESRQSMIKYMTGAVLSIIFALIFFMIGLWTSLGWGIFPFLQDYLAGSYGTIISLIFIILGGLLVIYFIAKYLKWISILYILTDQRIIIKRGIIGRSIEDMSLNMITNIDVRQSIFQRFLGYGTIIFSSEGGTRDDVTWRYVPDPFKVRREVQLAMDHRTRPKGS